MDRIELLKTKDGLSPEQQSIFDWVVESRGEIIRPYQVLLHAPGLARPSAELGHQIRYEGELSDHDRELAILTAAKAHDCQFEWDSHIHIGRKAGISESAIAYLESGDGELSEAEATVVGFVRELCADSEISDATFSAISEQLGDPGQVVELSGLVGYYTLLAFVMKVAGACG